MESLDCEVDQKMWVDGCVESWISMGCEGGLRGWVERVCSRFVCVSIST